MSERHIHVLGMSDAEFSEDGFYRFSLLRAFRPEPTNVCLFVMLNPSTADYVSDDPTVRRCIGFARSWGHDGIMVGNLYAMRTTRPIHLWEVADPVGRPRNDEALGEMLSDPAVTCVVAAWGANAQPEREAEFYKLAHVRDRIVQCLGETKDGYPRHPLYLRADTKLRLPWRPHVD